MLEINFQSIFSKREEFWSLVEAVKPDVIYGCETWLKPSISSGEIFPDGYDLYRRDRKDGIRGGVLIGIRSNLNNYQLDIQCESEFIAAKIINGNQSIIVAALYRPPSSTPAFMDDLNTTIFNLCRNNQDAAVWIAGDINLPDIDWQTNTIVSHQYKHVINESFLQMLDSTGLQQVIDFPTRGDNILDVVLTNRPSLISRSSPLPRLSDHEVVFVEANIQAQRKKPVRRKILLWKKANLDDLRQRVADWSNKFVDKYTTTTPVEELGNAIQQELHQAINSCVPSKMSSSRFNQPWINTKTKRASRRKARAYRKARRTNKPRDWARFLEMKKHTQKICRSAHNQYNEYIQSCA